MEVTRDDIPFGFDEDQSNTLAALKIALASLDAEPVRYLNKFSGTCVTLEQQSNAADDVAVYIPLYATPPAPVVPEKMNFSTACNFVQINGMAKEDRTILAMRAWNACRAAMLNGGKS
ncbi:Eaa protein [Salmonella enterica]|uniref:Eaa protein n=2 Tax=Salmonella enterica TaxID=28901 RepID=A0A737LQT0_SALER|nr:Eaa protein [Salmonella enterica]EBP3933321.1 Eaa protein [Salmonella enterica subsp. enterica]ECS8351413.1 Eaa protein [Salmonella enterica subsp. enterica serovar Typhimurium]EHN0304850.1 Eaa protein [Salmonella enterica subsp. enterica serovar Schwarzengrund]EIL0869106.1 Eaa protein [Salmonella enterica subsp. enterica serovar Heidelberg]HAC6511383.1 Eaa protein [Salmonella enterica subsp. enterica serovar Derby]